VSSAAEEKVTAANAAEAYRNEAIPWARGESARRQAEAEGYLFDRAHRASGDASRFTSLLSGYHTGPQVTRIRMYLEAVEQGLMAPSKLIVDPAGGGRRELWFSEGSQPVSLPPPPVASDATPPPSPEQSGG